MEQRKGRGAERAYEAAPSEGETALRTRAMGCGGGLAVVLPARLPGGRQKSRERGAHFTAHVCDGHAEK